MAGSFGQDQADDLSLEDSGPGREVDDPSSSPYNKSTSASPGRARTEPREPIQSMALNSANPAAPAGADPKGDPAAGGRAGESASRTPQDWVGSAVPAGVTVTVSPDGLKAFLSVLPPANPLDTALEPGQIESAWKAAGLDPSLLDPELLRSLAEEWNHSSRPTEGVLIAETEHPPRPGDDARIEYLVDPDLKAGPVEEGGAVDFRTLNLIKPVNQGQPLARRHPPSPGVPGVDLFGRPVSAPDGRDRVLPMGPNTVQASTDPDILVASVSGFLQRKEGLLAVTECFVVNGSVDYSTGNIVYDQSAVIRGDIADGFTVTVGGALEVGGSVGEAKLMVGGDILVKKGFVGSGQGLLTSKGNVTLGFASNQSVRAHGNIVLAKESFNCQLRSRKSISVYGPVVGGQVIAGEEILCRVAGNDLGTRTELEAGLDYLLQENRNLVEEKIKELTGHLQKVSSRLARFRDAYRLRKRFTSEEAKLLLDLRDMQERIQARLPDLERKKAGILEQIRKGYLKDNIRVQVEKKVNPGVVIRMGSEVLRIQEELAGPRVFAYSPGRIKVF